MAPDLPILFLDVDGPVIPFGGGPYQDHGSPGANPLLGRVDPALGRRLKRLRCQIVWATSWGHDANLDIAPILELPLLDVVEWPESAELAQKANLHWKTRGLIAWAGRRPFAWADDEISSADLSWARDHAHGPNLLHRVDPRVGLSRTDIARLHEWFESVSATRS